jgi:glycosyltransferase involved in cell wall biosynthesis
MLTQFYPPVLGGEEQYASSLSKQLAARGHEVAVVTLALPNLPRVERVDGVDIYRLRGSLQRAGFLFSEPGRTHAPPFPDPEFLLAFQRVIARVRPQIVHAHNWLGYQYLPLKAMTGAPFVLSLHDMSLVCAKKSYMYRDAPCSGPGLAKCTACAVAHYGPAKGLVTLAGSAVLNGAERRAVDMFLPVSRATAEESGLIGSGLPYEVMPNFIADNLGEPDDQWRSYTDQLPNEPFLLFVGGLRKIKGVEVLLDAYRRLSGAPPLVLIGYDCVDTPSTFPPGVVVLKNWPHGAVMQAWRRSLLGLVPSICVKTFGLVVLEAMVCGKPVIASRIGGLQEVVVDAQTGLLVEPGDPRALAAALERLLREAELRAALGRAALQHAAQYRASVIVPRIEDVYSRLLQRTASPSWTRVVERRHSSANREAAS